MRLDRIYYSLPIALQNTAFSIYGHYLSKKRYGGLWGSSAVGYVMAGESYEHAAQRELAEELGIRKTPLTHLGNITLDFDGIRRFAGFFLCVYNGRIVPDPREIEEGRFFTLDEAEELMQASNIMPSFPILFDHFKKTYF